jgi:hypothetical protein
MIIQTIKLPLIWYFKHTKCNFKEFSTHLDGSFDYAFTLVASKFIKESLMMHMIIDTKCHKVK